MSDPEGIVERLRELAEPHANHLSPPGKEAEVKQLAAEAADTIAALRGEVTRLMDEEDLAAAEREEAGAKVIVHLMTPPATIPVCGARTPSTTEIDHGASFMFTNSPRFVTCPDCRNATMTRQETADELTHEAEALGLYDRRPEEPKPQDLVHELHAAIYGESWARPESPAAVWAMLLDKVRAMAAGRCWVCDEKESPLRAERDAALARVSQLEEGLRDALEGGEQT